MSRGFLIAIRTMVWDPDYKDFAEWEAVSPVFQDDFKDWLKIHEQIATQWLDMKMPWSIYRQEYIANLLDREIENELTEETTTPARVANENGNQQGAQQTNIHPAA